MGDFLSSLVPPSNARAGNTILSPNRQNLLAFPLVPVVAITEQAVFPVIGLAGDSLQYIPSGSEYPVRVEVAFDVKGAYTPFSELQPGMVMKFGDTGFSKIIVRVTKLYGILTIPLGTFLGTLVVGTNYYHNAAGASPETAVWTREAPSVLSTGTRSAFTGIGALGPFSFRDTLPGLIEQNYAIEYELYNPGPAAVFIGIDPVIIVNNASNRSLVAELVVGKPTTIRRSGIPPKGASTTPTPDNVYLYSDDAGAVYQFIARAFR